jgi:Kdo2-lipid IVA lauroyltransferase/acyltransferase
MSIPLSHYVEYAALKGLERIVNTLPRKAALRLGACAGYCLSMFRVYRRVVETNMNHVAVFDKKEIPRIVRRLYANIGRYAVDFLLRPDKAPPHVIEKFHIAEAAFGRNKGTIVVLAHFGNWELLAAIFGTRLHDLGVLARPMHNTLVEKWLFAKRKSTGVTPIYASGALRRILTVLKRNGVLAMLIDQYSMEQGTPVPFLTKSANTVRTAGGLVYGTDCSIIFAYALMNPDGSYRVVIEPAPPVDVPRADKEAFIFAHLKSHNDVLSRLIRENPDHYFGWFHRRFKDVISYG